MGTRVEQLERLVEKQVHGVLALDHFFDIVLEGDLPPHIVANRIKRLYDLTENQWRRFDAISSRTEKACRIVDHFKEKYGMTRQGMFRDKKGLYASIYRGKLPSGYFAAKPHGFAIIFYLPQDTFSYELGRVARSPIPIDFCLEENLAMISKREDPNFDLSPLIIHLNYKKIQDASSRAANTSPIARLLHDIYPDFLTGFVPEHELKHVIDNIIEGPNIIPNWDNPEIHDDVFDSCLVYPELSATLYASRPSKEGITLELERDIEHERFRLQDTLRSIERQCQKRAKSTGISSLVGTQVLEEYYRNRVRRHNDTLDRMNTFPVDLLCEVRKKGKGLYSAAASFLIATTPDAKLPHRLQLINDYLAKHPLRRKREFRLDLIYAHVYDSSASRSESLMRSMGSLSHDVHVL